MRIYLAAAPHTFLRHKDGKRFTENLFKGIGDCKDKGFEKEEMQIFLAGGISGNLKPAWSRMADNTSGAFIKALKDEGFWYKGINDEIISHRPFILESFFYMDEDIERLLPYFGDFLLDSGAFTFMYNQKNEINWYEYIDRYADFIKRNDIKKFFELDIDSIVGYENVKIMREYLEKKAGRQSIPVWHINRGYDEFIKMCDEYPYVALGGIVGELKHGSKYKLYHGMFPKFINEAHKRKAKIHGLGFTALNRLNDCHFDSVDSTAWTTGNRFGYIYQFNGKTMLKHDIPKGKRFGDPRKVALVNYYEWIKFQKYAEVNL